MSGRDGDVNTGGIRDPSPNNTHLIATEKAPPPLPKKKKKKKKEETSASALETKQGCCTPV